MCSLHEPVILVIENDAAIADVICQLLHDVFTDDTYQVIICPVLAAAVEYVRRHPIPLVITDHGMPSMDGLEVTRRVKHLSPYTHVVFMTVYTSRETKQLARIAGADTYVPKPFDLNAFEQVCRSALAVWKTNLGWRESMQ